MSDRFQNKYRIESARLKHWDYGWNASYFVTICTQERICFFGDVVGGEMVLNEIGQIVQSEWLKTFEMRPDMNLEMGEYVVMPNHFHAIIGIGENQYNTPRDTEWRGGGYAMHGRDAMHCVSTVHDGDAMRDGDAMHDRDAMHGVSTTTTKTSEFKNRFGPQSKNLSSIIRGFKSSVTKYARQIHADFAWQSRFHDHIIRDQKSFDHISNYIITNPMNWSADQFFKV